MMFKYLGLTLLVTLSITQTTASCTAGTLVNMMYVEPLSTTFDPSLATQLLGLSQEDCLNGDFGTGRKSGGVHNAAEYADEAPGCFYVGPFSELGMDKGYYYNTMELWH
jgi:hypothetical protein